jgi:two-component system cell cycle sensor histidine kinase/response regulator CckA
VISTRQPETEIGRIRSILDLVPAGVIRQSATGEVLYANRLAAEIFSMQAVEIEGRTSADPIWQMVLEDGTPVAGEDHPSMCTLRTGEPIRNAVRGLFSQDDGRRLWLLISTEPMVDAQGDIIEVVVTFQDITERKRCAARAGQLQAQLLQSQKLEAVGRLAGGIAHDFNNLLTSITGNIDLVRESRRDDAALQGSLEEAAAAAHRAADLTGQLLAFSRKQQITPRPVDLGALLLGLEQMLRRLIGEAITIDIDTGGPGCCVRVDPGQIEQVLVNLAINARDAMPKGGRLSFRLGSDAAVTDPEQTGELLDPEDFVFLTVEDTGEGIPPELLEHLFEPFFTTKPRGQGTGLGLATAYGILRQHGGGISVASTPGEGTTFTIYLPRTSESPGEVRRAGGLGDLPGGDETILVVEDEDLVRRVIERILGRLGYRLLLAANGEGALVLSRDHLEPIDLLLTDVVMPGMNGVDLAATVQRERPGIAVLFSSGYSEEDISRSTPLGDAAVHLLPKPYTPRDLAGAVRMALDDA